MRVVPICLLTEDPRTSGRKEGKWKKVQSLQ